LLQRTRTPPVPALDAVRARISFARGEFADAATVFERLPGHQTDDSAPLHHGLVVDAAGHPVAHATVVAWQGELHGDPNSLVTDLGELGELHGDRVTAAADGTFAIHAEPRSLIIAQSTGLAGFERSPPQVIGDDPLTLRVLPTTALAGTVAGRNVFGVNVFARFDVAGSAWLELAPIEKDLTFHLASVPRATYVTGTLGPAGDGTRRVTNGPSAAGVTWPVGRSVEIVARPAPNTTLGDDGTAWVFRRRAFVPATRADAEAMATTASEVATASLEPIGSDATDPGREVYESGDRHAVITGNEAGEVTVCVAGDATPTARVTCEVVTVGGGKIMDYSDGRYGADVMAVLIKLR